MKRINKNIGAKVIVKELLVDINPKDKFKKLKNISGVIVERGEHEQYWHTSDGYYKSKNKILIKNDYYKNYAVKLDNGIVDIENNNIVVVRESYLKFLDKIEIQPKQVTEKQYLQAKKIVEKYESKS